MGGPSRHCHCGRQHRRVFGHSDTSRSPATSSFSPSPIPAVADVLRPARRPAPGKIVVDITNPLNSRRFNAWWSGGQLGRRRIAAALPQRVWSRPSTPHSRPRWPPEGRSAADHRAHRRDDADAKALLAGVIAAGGLRALDAGALARARELEAVGFLQLTLAVSERMPWTGGFGVVA